MKTKTSRNNGMLTQNQYNRKEDAEKMNEEKKMVF